MSSGASTSRASTATATCTSTTPGAACSPSSRWRTRRPARAQGVRQPPLDQPDVGRRALRSSSRPATRARVLRSVNEEYAAIFTPNATGALRLVGESYPFRPGDRFLLTFDNHNSVNGIREFARARGADTTYIPQRRRPARRRRPAPSLPRPTRSAITTTCSRIQRSRTSRACSIRSTGSTQAHAHGWDVLLDAAAYVPTNTLDLSACHPDFVAISFYKMFGWPTGVGCLLARRDALAKLERPWFSGGTIVAAFVQRRVLPLRRRRRPFEDGTVNYLNSRPSRSGCGISTASASTRSIAAWARSAAWLIAQVEALRHSRGAPATIIYGPRSWQERGATIAFNFLHPDGRIVDERFVDRIAAEHNVSLRTGCFCNPGAGEVAFTISRETLVGGEFGTGMSLDDYVDAIGLPSGGAIRASLGLASNFQDIQRFMAFAARFIDLDEVPTDLPPRVGC